MRILLLPNEQKYHFNITNGVLNLIILRIMALLGKARAYEHSGNNTVYYVDFLHLRF